jgi:NADH-quinone oxidoreductase subunit L
VANALILIPLLPFLGFLANGLLARRLPRAAIPVIACAGPAISAAIAFLAFLEVSSGADVRLSSHLWDWIRAGSLRVPFAFALDRLSGVLCLVVTGVGTLIHVYSIGYMRDDPGIGRYFAYLNLFMAAMLVLVLADNLVLLFLGWEGVGLCSYLLIGFWYKDLANCAAGVKAFVVNRIGDLGFLLGIFLVFTTFGTYDLAAINAAAAGKDGSALFWIALLLFVGATGKSAQIPLYVWLPDAMAGPTPVSALIHAATMVTSGVYLLARLGGLYLAAPAVLSIVAVIGVLTALLGALIALTQTDIKKVLAYSTVSQLGYMFFAAGMGAFGIAVFHLVTHAFFKALLFLGAGAVIHALHHEQDMRRMGGLGRKIPRTAAVFTIGALALAGFPLTSGFFSKDAVLETAFERSFHDGFHGGWLLLWALGLLTAVLTAFYAFRQVCLVFLGDYRGPAHGGAHAEKHGHDIHEPPPVMMAPLYALSALALLGGFLAVPGFLAGGAAPAHGGSAALGWFLGSLAAIGGIGAALTLYHGMPALRRRIVEHPAAVRFRRASYRKFLVDEAYDRIVVRPLKTLSLVLFYVVDRALIDGLLVRGSSLLVIAGGSLLRKMQTGRIISYTTLFVSGVLGILTLVLWAASR